MEDLDIYETKTLNNIPRVNVFKRDFFGTHQRLFLSLNPRDQRVFNDNYASRTMSLSIYDRATSLVEAVAVNDLNKVIEFVRNGYIIQVDKDGKSPVHVAVEKGYYEITKYLLQTFPMYNVNSPDQFGNTPLHKAANIGNLEIVKILLERGAQVNVQEMAHGRAPLHEAAAKGYACCVELLSHVGRMVNAVDYGLFTPLHMAVQNGHNQTARNLIRYGADLTAKNKFGDTPLHTAVRYGHAGVSRIIISVSTNVNEHNQNGDTPLHIAAALKRRKIVKLLIEAGALLEIRNYQNESPVDVAVKKNHNEILAILSTTRITSVTPKTVSFNPDTIKTEFFPSQSRHVTIFNDEPKVINQTTSKQSRTKSQSPHEKIKSKKVNIVKGIFSRKKKEKSEKNLMKLKDEGVTNSTPLTPSKSILCSSKRKKSDPYKSTIPGQSSSKTTPVPGLINIYQSQYGNLFFKDLAGNIKQGPIGYMPMGNVPSTCNCPTSVQSNNRHSGNFNQPANVCLDHGYIDYHGPMSPYQEEKYYSKTKKRGKENSHQSGYPLVKSKSDESLNQSEHKLRMQEERIKDARAANIYSSPIKGRRQNTMNCNWNIRQNSFVKETPNDQNSQRISVQVSQKSIEVKETGIPVHRSFDMMRTSMRPSPDGQTDIRATQSIEQQKPKVDWRAGKYRPDKIVLPSSKV